MTHEPHVLLVEDDDDMRSMLRGILQRDGYAVTEARNGHEALLVLSDQRSTPSADASAPIVAMVTDVRMPGVTGMELLELLNSRGSPIAVLVISAFASAHLEHEALRLGAKAVLSKPFSLKDFRDTIRRITRDL